MKKIIALILAMVMALSLVACGQTAQDDKSKDDANSTSAKTFIMGIDAEYPMLFSHEISRSFLSQFVFRCPEKLSSKLYP